MDPNMRSLTEAIDEIERELAVRRRIFPRWVDDGRMSQTEALDRLERMTASCTYLKRFRDLKPGEAPVALLQEASLSSQDQAVQ